MKGFDWTEKQKREWEEWLGGRPPEVRIVAEKYPPNKLYRMKGTGHRVLLYSYCEDGTVTVIVSGKYNLVTMERRVFGISPDSLEPCDIPDENEPVGAMFQTDDEILAYVNARRAENGIDPLVELPGKV